MFPVEAFRSTLLKLANILRDNGIRFHLTGGVTGAAYGEPRMTQDLDLVVDPDQAKRKLEELLVRFKESDFLFAEDAIRRSVACGDLFQLLDVKECLKLDVDPREMIPGELDRTEQLEIFQGLFMPVVSRVDAAASKLVWINKGSHKSRRDLRAIYRGCNADQKRAVEKQAEQLGLRDMLSQVLTEPDELQ